MKSRIKKAAVGALTVAMVLSIGGISAFATENEYGRNFVDVDEDGICDNCDVERVSCKECGRNFEDADGNGVCDKYDQRYVTRHETRYRRGFRSSHR